MKSKGVDWDSSHVVYEPGSFSCCKNSMKLFVGLHKYVHMWNGFLFVCLLCACMQGGRVSKEDEATKEGP